MGFNVTAPDGVDPAYYNESKQRELEGVAVMFLILTISIAALRLYARHLAQVRLWWDDWFAFASVPFCLGIPIVSLFQLQNGLGRHAIVLANSDPNLFNLYYRNLFIILILYSMSLAFFKWSVLALYHRIFNTCTWLRRSSYVLGAITALWVLLSELLYIFRCSPISFQWDQEQAGSCIMDLHQFNYINSVPTVFLDIAILALPIPLVWKLRLPKPTRIAVIFIFLMGGLVLVISVVRLARLMTMDTDDAQWSNVDLCFWSVAEPVAGLLSCSLMSYAPMFYAIRTRLGYSAKGRSTSYTRASSFHRLPARNQSDTESGEKGTYHLGFAPGSDNSKIGANTEVYPTRDSESDIEKMSPPPVVYDPSPLTYAENGTMRPSWIRVKQSVSVRSTNDYERRDSDKS